jgi:sugar lactone lactonase YvrE
LLPLFLIFFIKIDPVVGPESLAISPDGEFLYFGMADGWIARLRRGSAEPERVVQTGEDLPCCGTEECEHQCGRPLGLRFDQNGALLITDTALGLFKLDVETKELTFLMHSAAGRRSLLLDDVVERKEDGMLFLTDSSASLPRTQVMFVALAANPDGRILQYNPKTNETNVLIDHRPFPNGIQMSFDGKSLLWCETPRARIMQYNFETQEISVFAENLPGLPDNLRPSERGDTFLVGLASKRASPFSLPHLLAPYAGLRRLICSWFGAGTILKFVPAYGIVAEIDAKGNLVRTLQDPAASTPWISEATEFDGYYYLGSFRNKFLSRVKKETDG